MTEVSTRELIDRYQGRGKRFESMKFRTLVDMIYAQMAQNKLAPDEVRDAAYIAGLKFMQEHPVDLIYRRDDL